jgi:coproporphyrinogen III oxidase-like Fe-S oxidoreductase
MLAEYLKRTREGRSPTATSEEHQEDLLRMKEGVMLRLRLADGVPSSSFEEIRKTLPATAASQLSDAFAALLLEEVPSPPRVRLTRKGVLLSNEVFSALV